MLTTEDDSGMGMAGWGENWWGALGIGTWNTAVDRPVPVGNGLLEGASVSLVASNTFSGTNCAVKTGELYCWGTGWEGQLGNDSRFSDSLTPVKVDMTGAMAGTTITKVATALEAVCAVASGKVFCWGNPYVAGTEDYIGVPVAIDTTGVLAGKTVTDVAVLGSGACVIADKKPYCWGGNWNGALGNGGLDEDMEVVPVAVDMSGVLAGKEVTSLSASHHTVCAIADEKAYCWGENSYGQLGNGTTEDSDVPVAVGGPLASLTVTAMHQTNNVTCAIADERAFCWGRGSGGGLGTGEIFLDYGEEGYEGSKQYDSLPVPVDTSGVLAGKNVTHVAVGDWLTCFLADGKPYCSGRNYRGEQGTWITPDTTAWSPGLIDTSGTVLDGKAINGLTVSRGSVIVTYTPPPIGFLTLEMAVGPQVTLTSTGHYHADATGLYTYIYDITAPGGPKKVASCASASTCTWTGVPGQHQSSYVAYAAPPYVGDGMAPITRAASSPATPPAWKVSLSSSGNTLTATTNYSLEDSGLSVGIYDQSQDGYPRVGQCDAGTSCSATTSLIGHTYIAAVGGSSTSFAPAPLIVSSNIVGTGGPTSAFETVGGSNPAELNQCFVCKGDPVNTSNGEFFENTTDISVSGRGPGLSMKRSYSTQRAPFDGPLGYGWSFNYGMSLSETPSGSVEISQENGSAVTFTANNDGSYTAPTHMLATLVREPGGTWTYTRRAKEIFGFTSTGQLNQLSDLNDNTATLHRNAEGQVETVTDSAGRALTFAYYSDGRIETVTDPAGNTMHYSFDDDGRLVSVSNADWQGPGYDYNSLNLITTITDARGNTTTNTYDAAQRVISQTDRVGGITTFSYAANGTTTTVSPGGKISAETYSSGQLIKSVEGVGTPEAATWTYAYDQTTFGTTLVTDPLNHTSTATYDSSGNRLTSTDPAGNHQSWTYNTLNDVTSATNAEGTTTSYTWSPTGDLLTTSTPLTGTSQAATSTYDHSDPTHPGDTTSITNPVGKTTHLTYSAAGDLAATTDPLGNTTSYTYNVLGQRLTTVSPRGNTTTYTYHSTGELFQVEDQLGVSEYFYYDANGNRTDQYDSQWRRTSTTFDQLNRPTSTTLPDGTTTATGYDPDGNKTSQTDAAENITTYTYDSHHRVTTVTDPLNRATNYGFDAAGHVTTVTDASGRTTTNTYDQAGRKTGTSYSDGTTPVEIFTYTPVGQMATMHDGTGTTTSTYDSLGRLTQQTNGNSQKTTYDYDLIGHMTALKYPNGHTVDRGYDAAGRLVSVTDWLGKTTTITPDADGNTATITYGNGVTATKTYDNAGQTASITNKGPSGSLLASFTYTRDFMGRLKSTTTSGIGQPQEHYSYYAGGQLESANNSGYDYDPAGNVTRVVTGARMTYDQANQPVNYTKLGITTPISYDLGGNRLTGPGAGTAATYTWNQTNRLINANGTSFAYNAAGLRATRTPATGPSQQFAWDARASVPLMLTDGSTSYLYDDAGNPLEHIDAAGTSTYYQHDQYGSTRLLTNTTGAVSATYTYDPNGNLTTKTGSADTVLRWNGQAQDFDTGLYYLRSRYYDPITTQFINVDPLAALTRAIYTYASNNPLNLSDPLGLWSWNPLEWSDDEWSKVGSIAGAVALGAAVAGVMVASGGTAAVVIGIVGAAANGVSLAAGTRSVIKDCAMDTSTGQCGYSIAGLALSAGGALAFGKIMRGTAWSSKHVADGVLKSTSRATWGAVNFAPAGYDAFNYARRNC